MVESEERAPLVELSDDDRARLIDAIYTDNFKVTVGDVVNKTGLPANAVAIALRDMAFDSKAHILVDPSGNVAYRFKKRFERRLRIHPLKVLRSWIQAIFKVCTFVLKSLFGLALILSFWSFVVPLLIASVVKSTADFLLSQDRAGLSRSLLDWRNWPGILHAIATTEIHHAGKTIKSNILLDCYSFVFGDGDPNLDLEERRWQQIAHLIAQNRGVLTCEQLSPYIGRKATEDDMIPVMVRFCGTPEVTSCGELAYVFPSNVVGSGSAQLSTQREDYLQERYWKWTGISATSKALILAMAFGNALTVFAIIYCANSVQVLYGKVLAPMVWLLVNNFHLFWEISVFVFHLIGLTGVLCCILMLVILAPFMFFISVFFLLYPPLRILVCQAKNIGIWYRNRKRRILADNLANPPEGIVLKLASAQECMPQSITINDERLIFDSSRDSVEQRFDRTS
jgi:hypothetical protein